MTTWLAVSVAEADLPRLISNGPRRDFLELARRLDARVLYQPAGRRRGVLGRLLGPHQRLAWQLAGVARDGDALFADGEHIGLPLLAFLRLRRRRPRHVVMLGHLPGRSWKRALFRLLTRGGSPGTLLLHSLAQQRLVVGDLGRGWRSSVIPYHVDGDFWRADAAPEAASGGPPLIVAAGSEHRDYETLTRAVEGLDAQVVIAGGSHWARRESTAGPTPPNVRYESRTLPFAELRDLYARAAIIVVPLIEMPNQFGITTILEAMSMGRPVVVTATSGQREAVAGPLVRGDGTLDAAATVDRGPHALGLGAAPLEPSGLYVAPGDVAGLRAALRLLLDDPALRERLGTAARRSAEQHFSTDGFVERLARAIEPAAAVPAP